MNKLILLIVINIFLGGCKEPAYPTLTLTPAEKMISQYNDTTFNSIGFISSFSEGYVIADNTNKFVITVDHNMENLEIIGRIGRGPGEYPDIPDRFIQIGNTLYTCVGQNIYE